MRRILAIMMAVAALAGCEATKSRTASRTAESDRLDSIAEYRRTHRHEYSTFFCVGNMYKIHDPDCPLCRETRRLEVIAIVDSIINLKDNGYDRH